MTAPDTISPKTATTTNQSGMNLSFLETASLWSNIAVVALTVLAAIAGIFALYFSSRLGALKDMDFEKFRLDSTEKIATANSEAAKATQKAEEEKLARIKIEQRLADRILTDAQVTGVAEKIKSFTSQEYRLVTYWDLKEPLALASRIHKSLTLAHWKYIKPEHGEARGETLVAGTAGVDVYVHPDAEAQTRAAADSLVSALVAEQIEAEIILKNAPNNPDNILGINVGVKP